MGKADQFRDLSDEELASRIAETKEELFRLRVQHATLQLADTSQLRLVRRDIARMLTVQRERSLVPYQVEEA
ncbi:MAG: 50S ribosomal protein L29 [Chloroflexi bacterium]|nr:50S ribosomal protein L29 [Chloroflexota bacterium]MCY3958040.1 50S ribosomal protein L29 [Chloroflexota bacterium]